MTTQNNNLNLIQNRSEILFLYDAKDCTPNGDPFTGEQRYDAETQKAMVSDVRLKRYIRDYIDDNFSDEYNDEIKKEDKKMIVFYSNKKESLTTGEREGVLGFKNIEDLIKHCVDVRLFGCVIAASGASKTSLKQRKNKNKDINDDIKDLNLTGTVQFKFMNRSLNKLIISTTQTTSIMPSKPSNEMDTYGSIATHSYVPYALFNCIGYINPKTAQGNQTTKNDIEKMIIALWNEINLKNTRSKTGQQSRLLIKINYKDAISKIPDLDYSIKLKNEYQNKMDIRSFEEIKAGIDFSELIEKLTNNKEILDNVEIFYDKESFSQDDFEKLKGAGIKIVFKNIIGREINNISE